MPQSGQRIRKMQLKGRVLGYDDIATFELSDVIGSYKEDDVLYIQTSFGETPIVYSTIEPVSPIQEKEANRNLPPPEEWEFDEDPAAKEAIQEEGEENDYEILRKAGYDPDEVKGMNDEKFRNQNRGLFRICSHSSGHK